jgi:glycosyltransferase involved in cell wall biosynthesis
MRILFLSRWYPYPPANGSKLRIYNLLRGLANHHELTLISFADQPDVEPDVAGLQSICRAVHTVPWKPYQPDSRQARMGFFSSKPRFVIDTFSESMKACIEQVLTHNTFDLVIASQFDMANYSPFFRQIPALFEEIEVGVPYEQYVQAGSMGRRLRYGLTWVKHRRYLASLLQNFQACTVVSEQELQYLSHVLNGNITVKIIPNCIDLANYGDIQQTPQPNTLIFTGAFSYYPNYQAMIWFVGKVLPLIHAQNQDVQLTITGNHGNRLLPPASNVTLTGFVDDVRPFIASAWASIVPLHTGGGTRLKILEAMALGTPVIATSKGAEGLNVEAGKHLLIADTPEIFAQEVLRLLREPELRRELANNAQQLVAQNYDWSVIIPQFLTVVEQVGNASIS